MASELEDLRLDGGEAAVCQSAVGSQQTAATQGRGAIDLAALAAPLLLQRSPAARNLYWKIVLAPVAWCASGDSSAKWQALYHLHSWLALQLQCGRPAPTADPGTVYVEGPVPLQVPASRSRRLAAGELTVCLASPSGSNAGISAASTALAGASGVIMAVTGSGADEISMQQWQPLLSKMRIPILLVAGNEAAAQQWRQAVAAGRVPFPGPVQVSCVQEGATAGSCSSGQASNKSGSSTHTGGVASSYSRQQLLQGLRWLGAQAPPQPVLKVGCNMECCIGICWFCLKPLSLARRKPLSIARFHVAAGVSILPALYKYFDFCLTVQVVPVEELARDALIAASMPVQRSPAAASGGPIAAQMLCAALHQALILVSQAAK